MRPTRIRDNVMRKILLFLGVFLLIFSACEKKEETHNKEETYNFKSSGIYNGYDYVDLGLSVKWAAYNVGATKPEEYGDYFAWGEVRSKEVYNWYTYKFLVERYPLTLSKYQGEDDVILEFVDDAATVNWGEGWRVPTYEELDELKTKCVWSFIKLNGISGYKVIGPNANSIFLPVSGCMEGESLIGVGVRGNYWSSLSRDCLAYYVSFTQKEIIWFGCGIYYGFSVRAVCE